MKKLILLLTVLIFLTIQNQAQTVNDADGNVYDTIHIGTQVWLKENLATTKYNDGSLIPSVTNRTKWFHLTSPGYCWYNNDSVTYKNPYGALYNWYTVNTNKLCPAGWHVPSNEEWHTLVKFLDPSATDCYCTESALAGNDLKEAGLTHWGTGNTATNNSGFIALGAGFRNYYDSSYEGHTAVAYFWTSTHTAGYPTMWLRLLNNNNSNVYEYLDYPNQGFSVRCIIDSVTTGGLNNIMFKEILKIYPNPASDNINIDNINEQNIQMHIYNLIGECVMQRELNGGTNNIDIHTLLSGIYIIQLTGSDWTVQSKLTKE
jgi:uncharacterized protein (TIGR02145 family)